MRSFLREIRRRGVSHEVLAYVVTAFATLQIADLILPVLPAPAGTDRVLRILAVAGLPIVMVLAWLYDITSEGIRRDPGPAGGDAEAGGAGTNLWHDRRARRPLLLVTLLVGVLGTGAWVAGRGRPVYTGSSAIAVLPFAPATPDSALDRLGRDLVVTVSSALAGTADLSTVEPLTILARVRAGDETITMRRARAVASDLGADHLVHGSLLRGGAGLRLQVGLYETGTFRHIGTRAVSAATPAALADSAAEAVLRLLPEPHEAPPAPVGVATRSDEAVRAYLDGERALAAGDLDRAAARFARAADADPTFSMARWRLSLLRGYRGTPVDSALEAWVLEHAQELPQRDRQLAGARAAHGSDRLERLEAITDSFPAYWPAWWELARTLVHHGGYLGRTLEDSHAAIERTIELNPAFTPAWTQLFRTAVARHDDGTEERARRALEAAGVAAPRSPLEAGLEPDPAGAGTATSPEEAAARLAAAGLLDAQIQRSREILTRPGTPRAVARAHRLALVHALAARGAWQPALAAARLYADSAQRPEDRLLPYRIGVVGVRLDGVEPGTARALRPELRTPVWDDPDLVAEIGWLDGLLALAEGNPPGVSRARRAVQASGGEWARMLGRSLNTFATALTGDSLAAGRELATLERRAADQGLEFAYGADHPFVAGVHRLIAAPWLLASRDTATARGLLTWYETAIPDSVYPLALANQVLATPAIRLRRDLARAAGDADAAAFFAARYDERWQPDLAGGAEGEAADDTSDGLVASARSRTAGRSFGGS